MSRIEHLIAALSRPRRLAHGLLKRLDDMRHIEEDPTSPMASYGRRWRYQPWASLRGRSFQFGLDIELVRFKGAPQEPRTVQTVTLQIWPFPSDWKIDAEHIYYDGPHCIYRLGPFGLFKMWGWCAKCAPERAV